LGLLSVETGLNLMGSPLSITHLARGLLGGHMTAEVAPSSGLPTFTGGELVNIKVTNEGYFPAYTRAQAGVPIQLQLTTEDTYSCALAFVIPSLRIEHMLPTSGVVTIDLPTQNPGTVLNYTCSMGMYTGQIAFDQ
jgi:plastocyanin domain-containing protein